MSNFHPLRLYLVGTNTSIGKTTVGCAILRAASNRDLRVMPIKPAQSGTVYGDSDIHLLCQSTSIECEPAKHCFYRYDQPLAPGIAHDPNDFFGSARPEPPYPEILQHFSTRIRELENNLNPHITLIEAAGGLHVPMPAGTWQASWITASRAHVLVIAHTGLGTINHTLLTVEALRSLDIPILGVFFCDHPPTHPNTLQTNSNIIEHTVKLPIFGYYPSTTTLTPTDDWIHPLFWSKIKMLLSDTKRRKDSL